MNRKDLRDVCELVAVLSREVPDWTPAALAALVDRLVLLSRRHCRLMEHSCNYGLDERQERTVERLRERISDELPKGVRAVFQGDPRGATVKLLLPSGRTNDWGAEGGCVPGS
jgi:hypothetical protein